MNFSAVKGYATDADNNLLNLKPIYFEQFIVCFKLRGYNIQSLGSKCPCLIWHYYIHMKRAI